MVLTTTQKIKIAIDVIQTQKDNGGNMNLITIGDLLTSMDNMDTFLGTNATAINNQFEAQSKTNLNIAAKNALFTGVSTAKFG